MKNRPLATVIGKEMTGMSFSDVILGICVFLFGFVLRGFDKRITRNSDDINKLSDGLLKTNENLQRLSVLQEQCQANMTKRLSDGDTGFDRIDDKIDALNKSVAATDKQSAVLLAASKALEGHVNRLLDAKFSIKNEVTDGG